MSVKKINNKLTQKSQSKGEIRTFEIYNEKFVKVVSHNIFGDHSYHVNLSMLEPWPIHHRYMSWRWFFSFVYFSLATFIFSLYLYYNQETETLNKLAPFIYILVMLSLGSLVMFVYKSPNVTEFRSRYGGCVLLSLLQNKPSPQAFKAFIGELKTRILAASQAVTVDKKQMLEIEVNELRRLSKEGIVKEKYYQRAKTRLQSINI